MNSRNIVVVTGNLGADPEIFDKKEGSAPLATFSVAENVWKLNETSGAYEHVHTNWFPIRAFGSLAVRVRSNLRKGDRVSVFGRMRTFKWEAESGFTVAGFEILANDVVTSTILPKGTQTNPPDGDRPDQWDETSKDS